MFPYSLLTKPQYYVLSVKEVQDFPLWLFVGIVPVTAGLQFLLLSCDPSEVPERIIGLILESGYNLSENEREEIKQRCEDYNKFMTLSLLVFSIIYTINAYCAYSLRLFSPGFAIIYGSLTVFLPVALAMMPVHIYLGKNILPLIVQLKLLQKDI